MDIVSDPPEQIDQFDLCLVFAVDEDSGNIKNVNFLRRIVSVVGKKYSLAYYSHNYRHVNLLIRGGTKLMKYLALNRQCPRFLLDSTECFNRARSGNDRARVDGFDIPYHFEDTEIPPFEYVYSHFVDDADVKELYWRPEGTLGAFSKSVRIRMLLNLLVTDFLSDNKVAELMSATNAGNLADHADLMSASSERRHRDGELDANAGSLDYLSPEAGYVVDFFPLDESAEKEDLTEAWWQVWNLPWQYPFHEIKDYYGERVAVQTFFAGFLSFWLIVPALAGTAFQVLALLDKNYHRAEIPAFAFFLAFWSITFTHYWQRERQLLAMKWDLDTEACLQPDALSAAAHCEESLRDGDMGLNRKGGRKQQPSQQRGGGVPVPGLSRTKSCSGQVFAAEAASGPPLRRGVGSVVGSCDAVRSDYYGTPLASYIDGKPTVYFSTGARRGLYCASAMIFLGYAAFTVGAIAAVFYIRYQLRQYRSTHELAPNNREKMYNYLLSADFYVEVWYGAVLSAQMALCNAGYRRIARFTTELENHRTDKGFYYSYLVKVVMYEALNSFGVFFFIVFAQRYIQERSYFYLTFGNCYQDDCFLNLSVVLLTVFATQRAASSLFLQALFPMLWLRCLNRYNPFPAFLCSFCCCGSVGAKRAGGEEGKSRGKVKEDEQEEEFGAELYDVYHTSDDDHDARDVRGRNRRHRRGRGQVQAGCCAAVARVCACCATSEEEQDGGHAYRHSSAAAAAVGDDNYQRQNSRSSADGSIGRSSASVPVSPGRGYALHDSPYRRENPHPSASRGGSRRRVEKKEISNIGFLQKGKSRLGVFDEGEGRGEAEEGMGAGDVLPFEESVSGGVGEMLGMETRAGMRGAGGISSSEEEKDRGADLERGSRSPKPLSSSPNSNAFARGTSQGSPASPGSPRGRGGELGSPRSVKSARSPRSSSARVTRGSPALEVEDPYKEHDAAQKRANKFGESYFVYDANSGKEDEERGGSEQRDSESAAGVVRDKDWWQKLVQERRQADPFRVNKAKYDSLQDSMDFYNSLFLQFTYMTCFASALPGLCLAVLVALIIDGKFRAWRFCFYFQRIVPIEPTFIRRWETVFSLAAFLAVLCNAGIIAFVSERFQKWSVLYKLCLFIGIVFVLAVYKGLLVFFQHGTRWDVFIQRERAQYIVSKLIHRVPDRPDDSHIELL